MLQLQKRIRAFFPLTSLLVSGGMLFFVAHSSHAEEPLGVEPTVDGYVKEVRRQTALASDRSPDSTEPNPTKPDPTENIAREILQLQQQLGGSIVRDREQLRGWPQPVAHEWPPASFQAPSLQAPSPPFAPRMMTLRSKIVQLREAAMQLDTTAYRLENLDLYDQADALRDVASRFRRDARAMKQSVDSSVGGK